MDTRQRPSRFLLTLITLAFGLIVATGCKKHHDDDDHGHEHGGTQSFSQPHSYAEAVKLIHTQLAKIDDLIGTRQLDQVHAQAAVIRDVAKMMPQLALDASEVPREAIKEINLTCKDLAAKFGPIDEAGDSGNLAGTRKVYDEMAALFETLEKYADGDSVHGDHDHD